MSNEIEIYRGSNVLVTTERIVVDSSTYAVRNLTSVRQQSTPPNRRVALILILVGVLFAGFGVQLMLDAVTSISISVLGGGIAALAVGAVLWRRAKTMHSAVTTTAANEVPVLESEDADEIRQIVEAISDAIIRNGK